MIILHKVLIISGPNLNLLKRRDPKVYGNVTLLELETLLKSKFANLSLTFYQSNHEGDLIDIIQAANDKYDALLINAAGYTHTSISLRDALELTSIIKVEVHFSDFKNREEFRKISLLSDVCDETFYGKKEESYLEALNYVCHKLKDKI